MSDLTGNAQMYADLQDRLEAAKADNHESDIQVCETVMEDMRRVSLSDDDFDQLQEADRWPHQ